MAVKGGAFMERMLLNDDCTEWQIDLWISTFADNGNPRFGQGVNLNVPTSNSQAQTYADIRTFVKDYITNTWGITFSGNDSVQIWGCNLSEG